MIFIKKILSTRLIACSFFISTLTFFLLTGFYIAESNTKINSPNELQRLVSINCEDKTKLKIKFLDKNCTINIFDGIKYIEKVQKILKLNFLKINKS